MNKAIDLHTHTTASDGSYAPAELVALAGRASLAAIAVTDHDSIDGIDEALSASARYGVEVVPGVEIGVGGTDNMHILGFYIDNKSPCLRDVLDGLKQAREQRNMLMVEKLRAEGFDISYAEIKAKTGAKNVGRLHIAQTMENKGLVRDYRKVFKQYISEGGLAYVPRARLSEKDGIDAIRNAGGLPFLAHINYLKKTEKELEVTVNRLKGLGLAGIEAYYSGYTLETEAVAHRLADKFGLLKSGGTDFHGTRRRGIYLGTGRGNMLVPYVLLTQIKAAALKD